jgi:hypothetical protein
MPRYTSTQVYTDTNTKIVAAGYTGEGSKKPSVEKVENVMGSTAGAGSGEFDLYRSSRRRERQRLETMEISDKREYEEKAFAEKYERNKREAEERTSKNAEKRKRKKDKKGQSAERKKVCQASDSALGDVVSQPVDEEEGVVS